MENLLDIGLKFTFMAIGLTFVLWGGDKLLEVWGHFSKRKFGRYSLYATKIILGAIYLGMGLWIFFLIDPVETYDQGILLSDINNSINEQNQINKNLNETLNEQIELNKQILNLLNNSVAD